MHIWVLFDYFNMIRVFDFFFCIFSYPLLTSFSVCLMFVNLPEGLLDLQNSAVTSVQWRFYASCWLSSCSILLWAVLIYPLIPLVWSPKGQDTLLLCHTGLGRGKIKPS